jgi:hypothetical protein
MKKFTDDISPEADSNCLETFLAVNTACERWELSIESAVEETLLGELKLAISDFLYPHGKPLVSNFSQILDSGRVGPGASLGAFGDDFYTKLFSSPLTCTKEFLYDNYVTYFSHLPEWLAAEDFRASTFGECQVVEGNRLSFVPKNVNTSRSICTEPNLNMFYQLGLGRILERRLRQFFGIDFAIQQELNRELARIGSLELQGRRLVTIDLSSASDSLSTKMLREVLPPNFYAWLELLRSPFSSLPNGAKLQLNMISTMGNGFTFPLQTMLFACVVRAASRLHYRDLRRCTPDDPGNFGVFGDDIICEEEISHTVVRLLNILGFKVNDSKSFLTGPFRESCGSDFFRGQNVRGVYCKSLKQPHSRYAVINQLNLWSARQGIPLSRTVGRLLSSVKHLWVPVWENNDAGIRSTYSNLPSMRWSKRYQSLIYEKWSPRNKRIRVQDGFVTVPKGEKLRIYNPGGLLLAFLRGNIEQGFITVRQRHVMYSRRTGVAPNWDAAPTGSTLPVDIKLSNFGSAVAANYSTPR